MLPRKALSLGADVGQGPPETNDPGPFTASKGRSRGLGSGFGVKNPKTCGTAASAESGRCSAERDAAEPGAPGRSPGPRVHGRARGGDRGGTQGLGHARGGRCRAPDGDSSGGRREDPRALEPQPALTCPQGPQRTENARGRPPKRRKEGECTWPGAGRRYHCSVSLSATTVHLAVPSF